MSDKVMRENMGLGVMINMGLEVVELEMNEGNEEEVFRIENELWEMNK